MDAKNKMERVEWPHSKSKSLSMSPSNSMQGSEQLKSPFHQRSPSFQSLLHTSVELSKKKERSPRSAQRTSPRYGYPPLFSSAASGGPISPERQSKGSGKSSFWSPASYSPRLFQTPKTETDSFETPQKKVDSQKSNSVTEPSLDAVNSFFSDQGLSDEDEGLSLEVLRERNKELREKILHAAELGQHLLNSKDALEEELEAKRQEAMCSKAEITKLWQKIEELSNHNTQLQILNLKLNTKNRELTDPDIGTAKDLSELSVPHSPLRPWEPTDDKLKEVQNQLKEAQLQILKLKDTILDLQEKSDEAEIEKAGLLQKIKQLDSATNCLLDPSSPNYKRPRFFSPIPTSNNFSPQNPGSQQFHSFEQTPPAAAVSRQNSNNVINNVQEPSANIIGLGNDDEVPMSNGQISHMPRPGHRRSAGLGKRTRSSTELCMSQQEFEFVVGHARQLEERISQALARPPGDFEPSNNEPTPEEPEPDEENEPSGLVGELNDTVGVLQSEIQQMQAVINAQRAMIRSYREKEKGYIIFSSMNSGDYSNLANELAAAEEKISLDAPTKIPSPGRIPSPRPNHMHSPRGHSDSDMHHSEILPVIVEEDSPKGSRSKSISREFNNAQMRIHELEAELEFYQHLHGDPTQKRNPDELCSLSVQDFKVSCSVM